jgi:hypothetical protein
MIGRVSIKGAVAENSEVYGVVAQVIASAKLGGTLLPLNPTEPDNRPLGNDTFLLHELPKA